MSTIKDIPENLVSADLADTSVSLTLDATLYPLQAIYGAAYIFIDRCFVFLDKPEEGKVRVVLAARESVEEEQALRALVGEFANELLSCSWRHQITEDNRTTIETVTMQAIAGAMGEPSLDDLANFDFTDEALDDPLGIAQSWEEKHAKPAESADAAADKAEETSA